MTDLLNALREIVGEQGVLQGEAVRSRQSSYWHRQPMQAQAILRPATVAELSACLRLCHAAGQPVIPLGGNTGLAEATASTAEHMMLSLERMQRIEAVDEAGRSMTVEAGAILQTVHERAVESGLLFPVDLGARGSCTIGGMMATNAGGFSVLRYGMMRERVLGLEAVLADGTVISSLGGYLKNNTGYDLKQLFIGSEGTLGVITRAVLRLEELPTARTCAMIAVRDFTQVTALLKHLDRAANGALCALEVMWSEFFSLNTGVHSAHRSPFAEVWPFYLLVEWQGCDENDLRERFEQALAVAFDEDLLTDAVIAQSLNEREALWAIREASEPEELFFDRTQGFDVSLAIRDMEVFVCRLKVDLAELDERATLLVFGHLADGNLHLTVGLHESGPSHAEVERVVYTCVQAFAGAVSAEHGIGLEKKAWLPISRQPAELDLMRLLKRTLDPRGILNPGKIFDL
ncbi:FAD-binding oxidoreductase [Pseudomonas guineae]|uniref:FAD-binding oxidoreductase n=1 Tax=Pseudomonas guineae TaxID=425504 RepID=UPI0030EB149B